ncbi:MAG: hypothetical protein IJU03_05540 [Thermoguttaceae bacterium]|nr:hypothetical protein [Thermoguttaceae bacterium]
MSPAKTKTYITPFLLLLVSFCNGIVSFSDEPVQTAKPTVEEIQKNHFEFLQNKWKSYFLDWATLSCTYVGKTFCDGRETSANQNEYTVSYPNLAIQSIEDNNGPQTVLCESEKYKFRLTKLSGDEESWKVQSLTKDVQAVPVDSWESFSSPMVAMQDDKIVGHIILQTLGGGLHAGMRHTLPSLFRQDNLKVEPIEWSSYKGQEAVHIAFSYQQDADEKTREAIEKDPTWAVYSVSGEVWLDPRFFLTLHGRMEEKIGHEISSYTVDATYKQGPNGSPVPVKTANSHKLTSVDDPSSGKTYSGEITFNDDFHIATEDEKERFTLSYYQMPEPQKDYRFLSLRVLLLIIGVGIILYATFKHTRNKKQNETEAQG